MNLLNLLIIVSEKAANIARVCRKNQELFNLLVQEKEGDEANIRFFKDFKTLADVLIQETVRHDIELHFPVLAKNIYGEENNIFTNALGDTIEIKVQTCKEETATLLESILNGNTSAANVLACEVHKNVSLNEVNLSETPLNLEINIDNIGIWIDPIDSTAEYINAIESKHESGIYLNGLQCVTVLIGAFNKITGEPLLGVINQPFHEEIDSEWHGKCYWGSCLNEQPPKLSRKTNIVTLSKIEVQSIKSKLIESGFTLVEAAGAGYKLLTVITGLSDAYIVSKGTTFRWDVCGPHAILRALGGGVFNFSEIIKGNLVEIDYVDDESDDSKTNKYCNKYGLIAVRNKNILDTIMQIL